MEQNLTIEQIMENSLKDIPKVRTRPEYEPLDCEIRQAVNDMISLRYMPYDQPSFLALAKWLARFHQGKKHGLLLSGNVGTGKTHFVKTCVNFRSFCGAMKFVSAYKQHGIMDSAFWYECLSVFDGESWGRHIVIDELGIEPVLNNYGTKTEVLEEVINQRYSDWQRNGAITLITSNLRPLELERRYGTRTTDRLREMCDLIEFNGTSLRGKI